MKKRTKKPIIKPALKRTLSSFFKKKKTQYVLFGVFLTLALLLILVLIANLSTSPVKSFVTYSTLENMLNVSELSTFEAIYNGIAEVPNPDKPNKIDYHVSYEAHVKAGIDFDKIDYSIEHDDKQISIILPAPSVTSIIVDIGSLDFIFENNRANTSTVSEQAYKACIEDVTRESANQKAIYTLAAQNAENIVEALTRPFITQLDNSYSLIIRSEAQEL